MRTFLFSLTMLTAIAAWSKPQAYFHYKIFYTPDHQPYITTSLQFAGGTFKYKANEAGDLVTQVEITQLFKYKDSIIVFDKYLLDSPIMRDSTVEDFYDVQRYGIQPGIYDYELIIKDVVSGESISAIQSLQVNDFNEAKINFSDVEFIEDAYKTEEKNNFVKNGFFMLPYLTNYFPPETDKIAFYTELYNTDKVLTAGEDFMITYTISDYDSGRRYADLFKYHRLKASPVNPVIGYLPIETLPSGNYNLEMYLINKENDTIHSNVVFFQRRNDIQVASLTNADIQIDKSFMAYIDEDSIPYFLNSLMPISPRYEYESIRALLSSKDTLAMKKYFYAYWLETSPSNPQMGWEKYKQQVYYAEKMFGTQIKHGFETDRGRIHLKYGSPNSVIDRPNEPSAYPYQIWHYHRIGQRSNIRFVFYNPDLVTNDYPMLHSDMQGELQNYRWEVELHKRDNPMNNLDEPTNTIHYGGNSRILYSTP